MKIRKKGGQEMYKVVDTMDSMYIKVDSMLSMAKNRVRNFFVDEKGDTNFISILVLLGIALALAGIFLGFQEQIMTWVDNNIGTFFTNNVETSTKLPTGGGEIK